MVVLWKSDFIPKLSHKVFGAGQRTEDLTPHFHRMLTYHLRMIENIPHGSAIFIGDSITQGLCVAAVAPYSVNFGIGSDTTVGVLTRIPNYKVPLANASVVVIAIGVNDLRMRDNTEIARNFELILDALPPPATVVLSSILPVDERSRRDLDGFSSRIVDLNSELQKLATSRTNVYYLDNKPTMDVDSDGRLDAALQCGDGVHLNSAGNTVWINNLQTLMETL